MGDELVTKAEHTERDIPGLITYIKKNVNELNHDEKREVLQLIMNTTVSDEKIIEKGNGTSVRFRDLDPRTIKNIAVFIDVKLSGKKEDLQYFPDDVGDEAGGK
jgi:hypothetical protein